MKDEKSDRIGILKSLNRPIQLFGLLLLITEPLFIFLLQQYKDHSASGLFVFAIIVMPILFGLLLYRLFTKYPHVNLAPDSFTDQKDYLELFKMSSQKIENWQKVSKENISKPFEFNGEKINNSETADIDRYAQSIEFFLNNLEPKQLIVLHNWFNAKNNHNLALICIDIAIAKGDVDSLNFSFRSASLRKLGRNTEALYSAKLANTLDKSNIDSYYNIARVFSILGKEDEAMEYVNYILKSGDENYISNISKYFKIEK
jgi:tetratricopeptide (TPR) repeat protein